MTTEKLLSSNNEWYDELKKSSLTPPPIVFQIVWTILYIMIFTSLFLFILSKDRTMIGLVFFGIQLCLNLLWTPLFFRYRQLFWSVIVIIGILISLLLTILSFWKVSPLSSSLLLPYFIWTCFALYLNTYIYLNN